MRFFSPVAKRPRMYAKKQNFPLMPQTLPFIFENCESVSITARRKESLETHGEEAGTQFILHFSSR